MPRIPRAVWVVLAAAAVLAALPAVSTGYTQRYGILVLQYVGLALSWNIISGYAGYVSFGHVAFFGLGAYTGALTMTKLQAPWPLALLCGGLAAAAFALPLGSILLRLRGPFFAISMLGTAEALRVLAASWEGLTRGGRGISLLPVLNLPQVYLTMLLMAVAVLLVTIHIDRHRYGMWLTAIREDEEAAEVMGIPTVKAKVQAFVLSSFAPGVIGAAYAWSVSYIDPSSAFRPAITFNMVIMTIFGGAGTVWGPVLGAVVLAVVFEQLWARFPELYLAGFGLLVVLVVLFMPRGLLPALQRAGVVPSRASYLRLLARSAVPERARSPNA